MWIQLQISFSTLTSFKHRHQCWTRGIMKSKRMSKKSIRPTNYLLIEGFCHRKKKSWTLSFLYQHNIFVCVYVYVYVCVHMCSSQHPEKTKCHIFHPRGKPFGLRYTTQINKLPAPFISSLGSFHLPALPETKLFTVQPILCNVPFI